MWYFNLMRLTLCFLVSKLIVGLRDHKGFIYIYITLITIYLIMYIIHILKLNRDNNFLVSVTLCKLYKYWVLKLHSELTAHEIIRALLKSFEEKWLRRIGLLHDSAALLPLHLLNYLWTVHKKTVSKPSTAIPYITTRLECQVLTHFITDIGAKSIFVENFHSLTTLVQF
jgi:hypothetical protein